LNIAWSIVNKSAEVDDKTRLQALALINDCDKYKMELTTNGVVITDAIKFVQTNKEKLTTMYSKEDNGSKNQSNLTTMKTKTSWKKNRKRKQEK
jgi:hypothetical protein